MRVIERRGLDLEELKTAIANYSTILNDIDYWFKYKWKISQFIGKGMRSEPYEKFLSNGEHYINYMEWKGKQLPKKDKIIPVIAQVDIEIKLLNKLQEQLIGKYKEISYDKYLYTEHWNKFKEAALKNARFSCQLCGKEHIELNVHHKSYENRGQETFNDVIVLCKECHAKFHDKVS